MSYGELQVRDRPKIGFVSASGIWSLEGRGGGGGQNPLSASQILHFISMNRKIQIRTLFIRNLGQKGHLIQSIEIEILRRRNIPM